MSDIKKDVFDILEFREAKLVRTKQGDRVLSICNDIHKEFWDMWKLHQRELKTAGFSLNKNRRSGEWEVCFWEKLPEEKPPEKTNTPEPETYDDDIPF